MRVFDVCVCVYACVCVCVRRAPRRVCHVLGGLCRLAARARTWQSGGVSVACYLLRRGRSETACLPRPHSRRGVIAAPAARRRVAARARAWRIGNRPYRAACADRGGAAIVWHYVTVNIYGSLELLWSCVRVQRLYYL